MLLGPSTLNSKLLLKSLNEFLSLSVTTVYKSPYTQKSMIIVFIVVLKQDLSPNHYTWSSEGYTDWIVTTEIPLFDRSPVLGETPDNDVPVLEPYQAMTLLLIAYSFSHATSGRRGRGGGRVMTERSTDVSCKRLGTRYTSSFVHLLFCQVHK